jgi:hypothetical protein
MTGILQILFAAPTLVSSHYLLMCSLLVVAVVAVEVL